MHANAQWKQAFVLIVHQGHGLPGTSCNGAASTCHDNYNIEGHPSGRLSLHCRISESWLNKASLLERNAKRAQTERETERERKRKKETERDRQRQREGRT